MEQSGTLQQGTQDFSAENTVTPDGKTKLVRDFPFLYLPDNFHFIEQMPCSRHLVNHKENITYIHCDIPANLRIVLHIRHHPFPRPVKVDANQMPVSI